MAYSNGNLLTFALPLPITQAAHDVAERFARAQPTPAKSRQVRLNTLAVCVVNDYLQMMGFSTNLADGDSWQRIMQLCADTADLDVEDIGRLECRPLDFPLSGAIANQTCPIPPEVWEDRIGYVVVHIDESHHEANVLGFVETATVDELPLSQLHPPEALLDHLNYLYAATRTLATPASAEANRILTTLGRWFQDSVEAGWQTVEELLGASEARLAYGFRGESASTESPGLRRRAKFLDLGLQLPLALLVEISVRSPEETLIRLQVHPAGAEVYLPSDVQLMILDETGATFLDAQSREADNYMQLEFSGQPGERFRVQVRHGETCVIEDFII